MAPNSLAETASEFGAIVLTSVLRKRTIPRGTQCYVDAQLLLGSAAATGLLIALIRVVCAAGLGLRPFPALTLGAVCLLFLTGLFTRFALKLVARSVKPIFQRLFLMSRLTIFLISRLTIFRLLVFIPIFVHFSYSFDENTSREGLYDFSLLKEQCCSIL
jgi:hypothetical protein